MSRTDESTPKPPSKMWGGRFRQPPDADFEQLNESLSCDGRMLPEDLRLNRAWADALREAGLLTEEEKSALVQALEELEVEWSGKKPPPLSAEDVHSFVEARLVEKVGSAGYRIHTGRSRNDQVATDTRLHLKGAIAGLKSLLAGLVAELLDLADSAFGLPMPGFTHMQRAQPILFSHYLLSFEVMLDRDWTRLQQSAAAADCMPLGSGALAGCAFPVGRLRLAAALGFGEVSRNSLDAVSDRDFLCDFLYAAAMLMMHLSRLATDFILFSSREFHFLQMGDSVTTGSSLMPQKRNPDAMELVRGKAAGMEARLLGMMSLLRGLPSGYNKDLQEDKAPVFAAIDELGMILRVTRRALSDTRLNEEAIRLAAADSFLLATDLADYLVEKGIPFRQAHHVVGEVVSYALEREKELTALTMEEYRKFSEVFRDDVWSWLSLEMCLERRSREGGTAPERVRQELAEARLRWAPRLAGTAPADR